MRILSILLFFITFSSVTYAETTFKGYLRTGIGLSSDGGDQVCFKLPGASGKYRLGNECENYAELGLDHDLQLGEDDAFSPKLKYHGMLAFVADGDEDAEQYAPAFRNNYVSVSNLISTQTSMTMWVGKRFYGRNDIHINDYFYWDTTGPGMGIENYDLGFSKFSYGFLENNDAEGDSSLTHDIRFSDIELGDGTLTLGLALGQVSNRDETVGENTEGWSVNLLHKKNIFGGDNTLSVQYGSGGLSDPGKRNNPKANSDDTSMRITNQIVFNALSDWSSMWVFIYEDSEVNNASTTWLSLGTRPQYHVTDRTSVAIEYGFDQVKPERETARELHKLTLAAQYAVSRDFWSRPVFRFFVTMASWNSAADFAGVDVDNVFSGQSGLTFGGQVETWW